MRNEEERSKVLRILGQVIFPEGTRSNVLSDIDASNIETSKVGTYVFAQVLCIVRNDPSFFRTMVHAFITIWTTFVDTKSN